MFQHFLSADTLVAVVMVVRDISLKGAQDCEESMVWYHQSESDDEGEMIDDDEAKGDRVNLTQKR